MFTFPARSAFHSFSIGLFRRWLFCIVIVAALGGTAAIAQMDEGGGDCDPSLGDCEGSGGDDPTGGVGSKKILLDVQSGQEQSFAFYSDLNYFVVKSGGGTAYARVSWGGYHAYYIVYVQDGALAPSDTSLLVAQAQAPMSLEGGFLQIGDPLPASVGCGLPINFNGGGIRVLDGHTFVYGGLAQGWGAFIKEGAGDLLLIGASQNVTVQVREGLFSVGDGGVYGQISGNAEISEGATLRFNRSDNITYTEAIGGAGVLQKMGAGRLVYLGNANHTGGTLIDAGTLQVGNGGTSGSLAGNVTVASGATFAISRGDALNYAGSVDGAGAFVKGGNGTLTVTGALTHGGGTTVEAGTLQIGAGGTSGSLAGNVTVSQGARFAINRSDDVVFSNVISGAGGFVKRGDGTVLLGGANTFTGGVRVEGGVLAVDGVHVGNRLAANTAVTVADGGTFEIRGVNALPVNASAVDVSVDAGGKLRVVTGGSAALGANGESHTHLRDLTLNGGVVELAFSGNGTAYRNEAFRLNGTLRATGDAASAITFTSGHDNIGIGLVGNTFAVADATGDSAVDLTVAARLQNAESYVSAALTKTGAGTLALNAANTYSGGTTVQEGTLRAGNASAFGTGAVAVESGAKLDAGGFALANAITNRGGFLTGLQNYTGTQTLGAGVATYAGTVAGAINVGDGATLNSTGGVFTGAVSIGSGGKLAGSGTLASASIASGGMLAPGNSPGLVTFTGDLSLEGGSITEVEIAGGTTRGVDYDALNVDGTLTFGGTLTVTLIDDWIADRTTTFRLFNASFYVGAFDAVVLPELDGFSWDTASLATDGTLTLVATSIPEPAMVGPLAGLFALGLAVHRRRPRADA